MGDITISVREIQQTDIGSLMNYWLGAEPGFLTGMGVDLKKMPSKEEWKDMLSEQLAQHYAEKNSYCMIWQADNNAIGHCNVNKIKFGEEAYMHLHLWTPDFRQKGFGVKFVRLSIPYFFENLALKILYSEPYSLNPAPHKTLEKAGFTFDREYITIPGFLNFEQPVKRWALTRQQFSDLK